MRSINWMPEAREIAMECWHDEATKDMEKDPVLVEAIAKRLVVWIQAAAQNREDINCYRSLIERCGKAIGDRAYITNDGSRSKYVLCEKVTEIIEADYVNGGV